MILKTITDKGTAGAKLLGTSFVKGEDGELHSYEIWATENDYDDEFTEALTEEVSKYYLHRVSIFDYESNTDAGNGYDDYSKDETDVDISIADCIIDNGKLVGFLCTGYGRQAVLFIENGSVEFLGDCYSGRGYHKYESKTYTLRRH